MEFYWWWVWYIHASACVHLYLCACHSIRSACIHDMYMRMCMCIYVCICVYTSISLACVHEQCVDRVSMIKCRPGCYAKSPTACTNFWLRVWVCKSNELCKIGWLLYILSELLPLTIFLHGFWHQFHIRCHGMNDFVFFAQVLESLHITAYKPI